MDLYTRIHKPTRLFSLISPLSQVCPVLTRGFCESSEIDAMSEAVKARSVHERTLRPCFCEEAIPHENPIFANARA